MKLNLHVKQQIINHHMLHGQQTKLKLPYTDTSNMTDTNSDNGFVHFVSCLVLDVSVKA